jgi:hypothetical protein
MSGKGKLIIIAFIAVALLTAFGLWQLFALRFEQGDMFPPYSSLRSDPLGCKALFQALERSTGLEVRRNFLDRDKLKGAQGRTIYWLGADETLLNVSSDGQAKDLEALAREGNRLVIAFGKGKGRPAVAKKKVGESNVKDSADKQTKEAPSTQLSASSVGAWGVEIGSFDPPAGKVGMRPQAGLVSPAFELPATIPLHSRSHFRGDGKKWRPVYSYGDRAIVLERTVGRGSIVLLADPYLFSNEALRSDRSPGLFAWLQGANRNSLFEESHLGVYDTPGVMTLVKKHRLVPFLLALMTLAALYVWKSAVTFQTAATEKERLEGGVRDNFSGLVNLLRRNIAPGELLNTCFREWFKSFSSEIKRSPDLARELQAFIDDDMAKPAGKRDPVAVYQMAAGLLSNFRMR